MKKLLTLVLALMLALSMVAFAEEDLDMPWGDEWITLKVSVFDRGTAGNSPADDNFYTAWIQENFGDPRHIKIEWVVIPRSEEVSKLNTMMAGGDPADICFTYTESVWGNFVNQGGVYELTELLEEYAPTLIEFLGEDILQAGRLNGGQYAVNARRVVVADQGVFVRSDILEELGLDFPTTTEEFYEMLVAFKEAYPDCIPYAMASDIDGNGQLVYSFYKSLDKKDVVCIPRAMTEGFEDYVVFMNKLYNEGLISPDFALNGDSELYAEVSSGKAFCYCYNYDHPIRVSPGIQATLEDNVPGALLRPIDCFDSVIDGVCYHSLYNPWGLICFIPTTCQYPEAAVMYLNWLCEYDTIYFLQNGIEGETYVLDEDGIPTIIDVEGDKHFNSMQNLDYTLLVNGTWLDTDEKTMKAQATSYQVHPELYEEMYTIGNSNGWINGYHWETVVEADATYGTTLDNYMNEFVTKAIMAPTEEECLEIFYAGVEEYKAMGGDAVMEERLAAWELAHAE